MRSVPVALKGVRVEGGFWGARVDQARDVIIPYQWEAMNDRVKGAARSGCVHNIKVAAGRKKGEHSGCVFQDSDFGKWLEAAAYSLATKRDPKLERDLDNVVDMIAEGQLKDGYFNTAFILKNQDKKWTNLRDLHEMYVSGHLLEAAIAYYDATGKRKFLDVMTKNMNLINRKFGRKKGQRRGYPGHQEIELALVKLYRVTGEKKYLDLSKYFIDERGRKPRYFESEAAKRDGKKSVDRVAVLRQSHKPVREQKVAEGHAVRAMYMYSAMADLALETGDKSLLKAVNTLWEDVSTKQMYVTGGVGQTASGEAFTYDHDLPNETSYAETCAQIGLVFWTHRMLALDINSKYSDVMERALYNGVVSGISLDGTKFFYPNVHAYHSRPDLDYYRGRPAERSPWFGCACCPPNFTRLMTSLGQYVYSTAGGGIYTHLFMSGSADIELGRKRVHIEQKTEYPWKDKVTIKVSPDQPATFTFAVRIPAWCRKPSLKVNGKGVGLKAITRKGYACIKREWKKGDRVELVLPMPIERVRSNTLVRQNVGRVALMRGPVVYCLEGQDNCRNLNQLILPSSAKLSMSQVTIKGRKFPAITGMAEKEETGSSDLYTTAKPTKTKCKIKAIPYFAWANRGKNEMLLWTRER